MKFVNQFKCKASNQMRDNGDIIKFREVQIYNSLEVDLKLENQLWLESNLSTQVIFSKMFFGSSL
jgi:hypothetical protein